MAYAIIQEPSSLCGLGYYLLARHSHSTVRGPCAPIQLEEMAFLGSQRLAVKHTVAPHSIERHIRVIRGQKVMLGTDLAALYEVPTRVLNQAVRRNLGRFPEEFMFQLTMEEASAQRSQTVTLATGRGRHSKYAPLAFTEYGVVMLSSVLNSDRAIQMNILIIRTFLRLREMIAANRDLAERVGKLEANQRNIGSILDVLVDEIENMKALPPPSKRKIGFNL